MTAPRRKVKKLSKIVVGDSLYGVKWKDGSSHFNYLEEQRRWTLFPRLVEALKSCKEYFDEHWKGPRQYDLYNEMKELLSEAKDL